jgi:hypothetical protein
MYPLLCAGKYGVPLHRISDKIHICRITAACSDVSAQSRLTLVDDGDLTRNDNYGTIIKEKKKQHSILFDKKRVAACDANIDSGDLSNSPIVPRNGISVLNATNLVPGSIMIYYK